MSKLPSSFDPILLQDELMAVLKKSPLTSQLVPLRAEEIVQSVLEKPICLKLDEQVRQLKYKLEEEKKNKKMLRSDSKKKQTESEKYNR